MRKLRCVIADDEPHSRARIADLLTDEKAEIVAECCDGEEALAALRTVDADLVFLDIHMPGLSGLDLLDRLGSAPAGLVFVTAFDQFAIEAFERGAADYLLKPVTRERFALAFARASERALAHPGFLREALLALSPPQTYRTRLVVRNPEAMEIIETDEIDFVESAGNYVRVHVAGRSHLIRRPLKVLEQELDPARFVRVHRGALVNLARVRRLERAPRGDLELTLRDGRTMMVQSRFVKALLAALGESI